VAVGFVGAILAGGGSQRMGTDKALVLWDGRPLLSHVVEIMTTLFSDVVIVGRDPGWWDDSRTTCVPDQYVGCGPLGGLGTALHYAQGRSLFLAGCDMPYLNPAAVLLVIQHLRDLQAAVPVVGGFMQTLHAAYAVGCLPHVEAHLTGSDLSMRSLLVDLKITIVTEEALRQVDPQLRSVKSVNTPGDLKGRAAAPNG